MNGFDDSSHEMNNNELSADDAERMVNGDFESLEHAGLMSMLAEVRDLPAAVSTPPASGALAEFVGVSLITDIPAELPAAVVDVRAPAPTPAAAPMRRKNSVFAQIITFAGSIGGKVCLTGAVAAASVTGAHATGVVDVPGLPDTGTKIETIDTELGDGGFEVADMPDAITFSNEEADKAEKEAAEKEAAEKEAAEKKEKAEAEAEREKAEKEAAAKEKAEQAEKEAAEKAEKEAAEKEAAEQEAAEKAEKEAAELAAKKKAEEEAAAKKAAEKKAEEAEKKGELTEEQHRQIAELEEQLHKDKDAVRAEAREKIEILEAELRGKRESREADLREVDEEFEGYIADINAQIEAATSEEQIAELEAYRENKYIWWEEARVETEQYWDLCTEAVEMELEAVEVAREAEIKELIEEFQAAVKAVKN